MERKLFWGITTPGGVLTVVFGLWLWLGWFQGAGLWLHAKLALVAAAGRLPRVVRQADAGFPQRAQHAQPCLVPLVQRDSDRPAWSRVVLLVVLKPGDSGAVLRDRAARPGAAAGRRADRAGREERARRPRRRRVSPGIGKSATAANLWSRLASRVLWRVARVRLRERGRSVRGRAQGGLDALLQRWSARCGSTCRRRRAR